MGVEVPLTLAVREPWKRVSNAQVERLFGLVESDTGLERSVRSRVKRLRSILASNPDLAYDRLCEVSTEVAAKLPRNKPTRGLSRFVSVEVFYQYHLSSDIRAFFPTPEAYRRFLDRHPNPNAALMGDLSTDDPTFPARHSWLVPTAQVEGVDGSGTIRILGLRGEPPLVRFDLPLKKLRSARVTVREARAVDAVCEGFSEWNPSGPSPGISESIDGDVPRSTVASTEFRR